MKNKSSYIGYWISVVMIIISLLFAFTLFNKNETLRKSLNGTALKKMISNAVLGSSSQYVLPETEENRIPVRIILPGGGIKGAFQIGFIKAMLNTKKYNVDFVYGCSAGAIIAPFVVANKMNDIEYIVSSLNNTNDIIRPHSQFLNDLLKDKLASFNALFKMSAYKSFTIVDIVITMLEQYKYAYDKCSCVAFDMINRKELWFTGAEYPNGMRASSALWLVVPPMPYNYPNGDRTYLIDGAATEVIPVTQILQDENAASFAGKYVVVLPFMRKESPLKTMPTDGLNFSITVQNATSAALADRELDKLIEHVGVNNIVIVSPDNDPFTWALDINRKKIVDYIDLGVRKFDELSRAGIL